VIRVGEAVFVDTGAWIALALTRDPLHARAAAAWPELLSAGAKLHTSVPVVIETFTFLDRNTTRQVALTWKESLSTVGKLRLLP
jgi:predicted nucleic acid-binding protein